MIAATKLFPPQREAVLERRSNFEARADYLYSRFIDNSEELPAITSFLTEILKACRNSSRRRVLVEHDIPATISETNAFFAFSEFASNRDAANVKIAFLDKEPNPSLEFGILVANNRGAHLRLFAERSEAEAWLEAAI